MADHGSITHAAEALHSSQPAASQQLAALERETHTQLLHGEGRGVRLTIAAASTSIPDRFTVSPNGGRRDRPDNKFGIIACPNSSRCGSINSTAQPRKVGTVIALLISSSSSRCRHECEPSRVRDHLTSAEE